MAHTTAINHYRQFLTEYGTKPGSLLDVGGEGGDYSSIAHDFGHLYSNVGFNPAAIYDVTECPYEWPIKNNWFDYVVCASTLEHCQWPWETFREMARVTAKGGYIFVCAPSAGPQHWSWDGWRFYPDSMKALAEWGKVYLLRSWLDDGPEGDQTWKDCVGIFQKIK